MVAVAYQADYAQSAAAVWDALTDEAFLAAYAAQVGALRHDASVERTPELTRTRLLMTVPTTGVPSAFKRFVTPTLDITEVRTWGPGEQRFTGTATVDAAVGKREAHIRGALTLATQGEGSRFSFDGDISVKLRLVGDAAALLIKDLVRNVLAQQTKVLASWPSG